LLPAVLFPFALIATGCSGSSSSSNKDAGAGGSDAPTGTGGARVDAGDAGDAPGDAADDTGPGAPFVYFVKQANGTNTATLASGTFSVNSVYGPSGNAFKYVAPNYYGTVSNGFIAFPTPMTGDFSITAEVNVTTQNKPNNACGVGVGLTTGFSGTDAYAYILMRNANNSTNGYYVSAAGATSAGAPVVTFDNVTPLQLTFSRTGTNLTYGAGPVGGMATTQTTATSAFTNGTLVYGDGAVYPAISFNNVAATITNLVIKDASGATVYDSATGALVTYVPASLTLSASTASMAKGASATVTATAVAIGGVVSGVTAVSADPTVATATVANGAASSTITLNGLKGGVTTVTVTNTSDSSSATNTKTIVVSVAEYAATDPYGSIATLAYPAPAAANAYTDGELALTFDVPPALKLLKSTGIRLAFLSNATPKILDSGIKNSGLEGVFEHVLSTDPIKTYKPDPRAYQAAIDAFGLKKEEILFVAFAGWDAVGAKSFGYTTFWVNRLNLPAERLGASPDAVGQNLNDLVGFVKARQ